ncbi:hypothetical protein MAR_032977 [Mya arenaria]|uniref:Uncharacterized protein n=1 Tax=Mya arenaria TaxID=6604 RepID=A0ABY7G8I9_MYAAR|nr:hypothetical protein MAR_032977 [Mya arenaria]
MTSTKLTSTPASASFIDVEKTPSVSEVSAPESQIASSITIDITLQESDEEAGDDPDFEPDLHMSSVLPENLQNFPDVTFEEAVFGQEEAAESDGEKAEVASPAVGQKKIVNEADIDALCSTPTCIVFLDQL